MVTTDLVTTGNYAFTFEWENSSIWDNETFVTDEITTKGIIKPPETPPITGTRFAMGIVMSMIIPISVIGNTVVLAAISKTRSLQRPNTMMYISLSVSDFIRTLVCMPFFTYSLFTNKWEIPEELCPFSHSFYIMVRFVIVANLTVISIERWIIITRPLLYHRIATKKRMFQLIAIIWSVSIVYGALNILWFFDLSDPDPDRKYSILIATDFGITVNPSYYRGSENSENWATFDLLTVNIPCRFNPELGFVIFDFILTFIIPLGIMLSVYIKIFFIVRSQLSKVIPHQRIRKREPTFYDQPLNSSESNDNIVASYNTSNVKRKSYKSQHTDHHTPSAFPDQNNVSQIYCENICKSNNLELHTLPCEDTGISIKVPDIKNGDNSNNMNSHCFDSNASCKSINDSPDQNNKNLLSVPTEQFGINNPQENALQKDLNTQYTENIGTTILSNEKGPTTTLGNRKAENIYIHRNSVHNGYHVEKDNLSTTSSKSGQNRLSLRENKAFKLSIAVIGAFVFCYAPFEITFLIESACSTCIGDIAWMTVNTLAFLSSAVNPFVYSLYSSEFRRAIRKLFIPCFSRCCKNCNNIDEF